MTPREGRAVGGASTLGVVSPPYGANGGVFSAVGGTHRCRPTQDMVRGSFRLHLYYSSFIFQSSVFSKNPSLVTQSFSHFQKFPKFPLDKRPQWAYTAVNTKTDAEEEYPRADPFRERPTRCKGGRRGRGEWPSKGAKKTAQAASNAPRPPRPLSRGRV